LSEKLIPADMKIALTGHPDRKEEWRQRFGSSCNITEFDLSGEIPAADLIVDLSFDDQPENILSYSFSDTPLLLSAVKIRLSEALHRFGIKNRKNIYGINALPGFINRSLQEISLPAGADKVFFEQISGKTGMQAEWVGDRVGMVSPRILCMIINEAYYTVQEGTASRKDIDTGMKLGTAYPLGPFEWSEKIGLKTVYEILDALYADTREERYKICPLLKTEAIIL
jgi:3-hydroxybutyryl-CoA dehydrogenase